MWRRCRACLHRRLCWKTAVIWVFLWPAVLPWTRTIVNIKPRYWNVRFSASLLLLFVCFVFTEMSSVPWEKNEAALLLYRTEMFAQPSLFKKLDFIASASFSFLNIPMARSQEAKADIAQKPRRGREVVVLFAILEITAIAFTFTTKLHF